MKCIPNVKPMITMHPVLATTIVIWALTHDITPDAIYAVPAADGYLRIYSPLHPDSFYAEEGTWGWKPEVVN